MLTAQLKESLTEKIVATIQEQVADNPETYATLIRQQINDKQLNGEYENEIDFYTDLFASAEKHFFTISSKDSFSEYIGNESIAPLIFTPLNNHSRDKMHCGDIVFCYRQGQFDNLDVALDTRGIYGVGIVATDPQLLFPNRQNHEKYGVAIVFPIVLNQHLKLREIQLNPRTINLTPYNGNRNDALQYIESDDHVQTLLEMIARCNPILKNNLEKISGKIIQDSILPSEIWRNDQGRISTNGITKERQRIFFGAPGTGKSHSIKQQTSGKSVIRTTFHPDSDYSTFVGSYKPTMEEREVRVVPVVTANGINLKENQGTYKEKRIVYKFIKQAFLKAYLSAWKKYSQAPDSAKEQFLVIEEINRGNCAQIFGDIFQLLDRSDNGFSSYPIEADNDIQQEIAKAFGSDEEFKIESDLQVDFAVEDYTSNYGETLSKDIQKGRIMLFPPNLYIWATMNTSDQSLFPIDSAFKRRWEWIYIPINTREKEWFIHFNGTNYVWGSFLEEINKKIGFITSSEDKKLGFYFCKATNNIISADRFVGKVLFYIYNDVFKDYGFDDEMFKKTNEKQLSFQDFYRDDGTINEEFAQKFLDNLHVITQRNGGEVEEDDDDDDEAGAGEGENGRDRSRYTINGEGNYPKKELSTAAIQKYIELNPQKTVADVINDWQSLGNIVPHFIESHEQYEQRTDRRGRDNTIDCRGEIIHVEHNGWQPNTIQRLIDAVNGKNWGIVLAKRE